MTHGAGPGGVGEGPGGVGEGPGGDGLGQYDDGLPPPQHPHDFRHDETIQRHSQVGLLGHHELESWHAGGGDGPGGDGPGGDGPGGEPETVTPVGVTT